MFNFKIIFLVGYYSKDLIIECFFSRKIYYFSTVNLIIGTILTVSCSFWIILVITNKYLIINVVFKKEDEIMEISIIIIILRLIYYEFIN